MTTDKTPEETPPTELEAATGQYLNAAARLATLVATEEEQVPTDVATEEEQVPTDVALSVGRRICDIAGRRKAIARERAIVTDVHRECLDRLAQLTNAENDLNAELSAVLA